MSGGFTLRREGIGLFVAVLFVALAPALAANGFQRFLLAELFIYVVAAVTLNVLLGYAGLISLGHSALFVIGAYSLAITQVRWEWPFLVGVLVAAVLGAALGLLIGLPALRLGPYTLGMATLGLALVVTDLAFAWSPLTGGSQGIAGIQTPAFGGVPMEREHYVWVLGGFALLVWVLVRNVIRSPIGRAFLTVNKTPLVARSVGLSVERTQLEAFVFASVPAAVAGALFVPMLRFVSAETFTLNAAILFLLMVIVGGVGTLTGPVLGALVLLALPVFLDRVVPGSVHWNLLVYGATLLLFVTVVPKGVVGLIAQVARWVSVRWTKAAPSTESVTVERSAGLAELSWLFEDNGERDDSSGLVFSDMKAKLGGVQALDGVSIDIRPGEIHGLIGPNGSGKTTFINCATGFIRRDEGSVEADGRPVDVRSARDAVALGMCRTFQHPQMTEGFTCLESVMSAVDRRQPVRFLASMLRLPRARRVENDTRDRAVQLLHAVGLSEYGDAYATELPSGLRQLLSVARALGRRPQYLVLDEPAAGLDDTEVTNLADVIQQLSDAGIGVLLVDHHFDFIMRLCDRLTVLDRGRIIAQGLPDEVRRSPAVLEAYLGSTRNGGALEPRTSEGAVRGT